MVRRKHSRCSQVTLNNIVVLMRRVVDRSRLSFEHHNVGSVVASGAEHGAGGENVNVPVEVE